MFHLFTNEHFLIVKTLLKNNLANYKKKSLRNFCMILWLQCYKQSIETVETYSADYIKFARVKKDEDETSNVNINDEKQELNNIIHDLPMKGCKIIEKTKKEYRFFFSLFEKSWKKGEEVDLKFFLFTSEKENKSKLGNVSLYGYTLIRYNRKELLEWDEKVKELQSKRDE